MRELHLISINLPGIEAALKLRDHLRDAATHGESDHPPGDPYRILIHAKGDASVGISYPEEGGRILYYNELDSLLEMLWRPGNTLLFFLATGIVVRKIAPFLRSKYEDPAILVMDFRLRHILPLLSGHAGGANEIAMDLSARIPGCDAFLTTATDQQNVMAFDLFALKNGFEIENSGMVAKISNALLNGESITVWTHPVLFEDLRSFSGFSEKSIRLRPISEMDSGEELSVQITPSFQTGSRPGADHETGTGARIRTRTTTGHGSATGEALRIRIRPIAIGCGMNLGTSAGEIDSAFRQFLNEFHLVPADIERIASFIAKEKEPGLLEFSRERSIPLAFFQEEEINRLAGEFSASRASDFFGIKGVAEPCAVLASRRGQLFVRKHVYGSVTLAAAF